MGPQHHSGGSLGQELIALRIPALLIIHFPSSHQTVPFPSRVGQCSTTMSLPRSLCTHFFAEQQWGARNLAALAASIPAQCSTESCLEKSPQLRVQNLPCFFNICGLGSSQSNKETVAKGSTKQATAVHLALEGPPGKQNFQCKGPRSPKQIGCRIV